MKKIDLLIVRSFLPPLIMWTLIAMFIFNMQFLWKYIDDIIGKGLDLSIILELLFYQSLAMIPRAMVFGVLIAAVMTLGNLAEHYELVTLKSAGVSLFRIMRPLIFFGILLATVSMVFSDKFIPITALKFKSILRDIRNQKPALSFKEGQYNDDFKEVAIFVGKKGENGKELHKVKIYDHTDNQGYRGHTDAEKAGLYYTKDTIHSTIKVQPEEKGGEERSKDTIINRSFLVIKLKDGTRYSELDPKPEKPKAYPHMQMNFETYTTMFDMTEFDFKQSDKNLFKGHHSLLSIRELLHAIDSLYKLKENRLAMLKRNANSMYHFRREGVEMTDTTVLGPLQYPKQFIPAYAEKSRQLDTAAIENITSFSATIPTDKIDYLYQRAIGFCQNIKGQARGVHMYMETNKKNHVKYENEIHQKLSFAFACLLFLFIGAPMGAIIRKGGFGYPILIAFLFFMAFFVLFLAGERLAKNLTLTCWVGSWLPNLVLLPFGFYLTYKALNDTRTIRLDKVKAFFQKIFKRK